MDLKVKAKQYILCSQYFVLGKRSRLKICVILGLNLINLRGTVPNTPAYSHALFKAWEYSLLISIHLLLQHILAPYRSPYPLYSLVSSLDSHISPYPLHIPSTPSYRLCSPMYPRIYRLLYSHISPYPSTYPLYSLVSSLSPHIFPCPSTYPLYSLVSSLFPHISPYTSTYTLYSLYRLCNPIYPRALLHIPFTPFYRLCTPIYSRTLLHIPSTPLYRLCTPIYPRALLHIPSTPLYCLSTPIYPRALLHIPSNPLYRLSTPIYPLYYPVTSLHSYISLWLFTYPSASFFLSSYNTLNEFAGQRSRKFLGKITEQAILPSQSFKEVINKRPCS